MTMMALMASIVILGAVGSAGTGSLSAFGAKNISAICPLGYLETALAGQAIMPRLLISFLVIAGLTALVGRVFCGWICPIPLVRSLLLNKADEGRQFFINSSSLDGVLRDGEIPKASCSQTGSSVEKHSFSGLTILSVTLASSAICGFPVFCLVCPIGLCFATVFALIRLLNFNEPTLDLIVFPAVIIVELVFLKKWCSKWCPVGALLSLFSRFNRSLVPTVDRSRCLEESRNTRCRLCRDACSFDIDIKHGRGTGDISECTKCRDCATNCPVHAIQFPWRRVT
jgi:ferredoxin-type protein NapH